MKPTQPLNREFEPMIDRANETIAKLDGEIAALKAKPQPTVSAPAPSPTPKVQDQPPADQGLKLTGLQRAIAANSDDATRKSEFPKPPPYGMSRAIAANIKGGAQRSTYSKPPLYGWGRAAVGNAKLKQPKT